MRNLIRQANPEAVEAVKWRKPSNPAGVPVWEHAGIICTGQAFKNYVKLTFAKGATLPDPSGLFNASLEGNAMRAPDIRQGDEIDEEAFKALIRAAVGQNISSRPGCPFDPLRASAFPGSVGRTALQTFDPKRSSVRRNELSGVPSLA